MLEPETAPEPVGALDGLEETEPPPPPPPPAPAADEDNGEAASSDNGLGARRGLFGR